VIKEGNECEKAFGKGSGAERSAVKN